MQSDGFGHLGRILLIISAVTLVGGLLLTFGSRLPLRLGRLPGDFVWRRENLTVYLPLATSVLLSVVLSVIVWLFQRRS